MFAGQRLKELEQAQDLLVLEAARHREIIAVEAGRIMDRFDWVTSMSQILPRPGGWVLPGALIGGLLAATRFRKLARWVPLALSAFKVLRQLGKK